MSVGVRWSLNVLLYVVVTTSAFAIGSTGWPGHWFVEAVEWATGATVDAADPSAAHAAQETRPDR